MSSSIPSIAFVMDISRSMDEHYEYVGRRIELAKQLFRNLPEVIFYTSNKKMYRLYFYVFPSYMPDIVPCEKIDQLVILDDYTLMVFRKIVDSVDRTRDTTPLIETLLYVSNDIEKNGLIITVTDGKLTSALDKKKVDELKKRLDEKNLHIIILCLNKISNQLNILSFDRVEIETLYPQQLHNLLLKHTLENIVYTRIRPKIRLEMK